VPTFPSKLAVWAGGSSFWRALRSNVAGAVPGQVRRTLRVWEKMLGPKASAFSTPPSDIPFGQDSAMRPSDWLALSLHLAHHHRQIVSVSSEGPNKTPGPNNCHRLAGFGVTVFVQWRRQICWFAVRNLWYVRDLIDGRPRSRASRRGGRRHTTRRVDRLANMWQCPRSGGRPPPSPWRRRRPAVRMW
jgi:hypothetical protein